MMVRRIRRARPRTGQFSTNRSGCKKIVCRHWTSLILAAPIAAGVTTISCAAGSSPCTYASSSAHYTLYQNIRYYVAPDGTALQLDAYVPNFVAHPPVIEMVHGGGFVSGSRREKSLQAAYFANQGFAVVNIDYRLVTPETVMKYFAVQVPDARCALRWTLSHAAHFGWDATKVGVTGFSAGATIASDVALTGSRSVSLDGKTPLDAATCPFGAKPYSVKSMNLYYGQFQFGPQANIPLTTSSSATEISASQAISPINYVTTTSPAAFLENGNDDTTVLPWQSQEMSAMLSLMNVPNLYFELQGEGHNFAPQETGGPGVEAAPWCSNVAWLHQSLGG